MNKNIHWNTGQSHRVKKSVKSMNPWKSVVQTTLSYNIAKAHGGELKVESKANEGTEFILQLPFEIDKIVKDE